MGNIIDSMCMTWRHDYGLHKDDDESLCAGMTTRQREALRRDMAQLYAHHVQPLEQEIENLKHDNERMMNALSESVATIPDGYKTDPCNGMNCGCTDGVSHSPECLAQTAATYAGGYFVKAGAVVPLMGITKDEIRAICRDASNMSGPSDPTTGTDYVLATLRFLESRAAQSIGAQVEVSEAQVWATWEALPVGPFGDRDVLAFARALLAAPQPAPATGDAVLPGEFTNAEDLITHLRTGDEREDYPEIADNMDRAAELLAAHHSQPLDMVSSGGEREPWPILTEWRAAWQENIDATAAYNARVAYARANEGERIGSISCQHEYERMHDARQKVYGMLPELFEGTASAAHRREDQREQREAIAVGGLMPGCCYKCGLPLSINPHPEAGKPDHYLEVGCPKECIPCLTRGRHNWAGRAMKAEGDTVLLDWLMHNISGSALRAIGVITSAGVDRDSIRDAMQRTAAPAQTDTEE